MFFSWRGSYSQFTAQHRYRASGKRDAIARYRDAQYSAAGRSLIRHELGFSEARGPIGRERAVRRAGHRVLVDAGSGREEARDEIESGRRGAAGDDDAAHTQAAKEDVVRHQRPDVLLARHLDEVVEFVSRNAHRLRAE